MKIQLFEKFAYIRFPRTKHRVLVSCRTLWILSGLFFFCPTLCLNKSRFSSTSTFSQSCPPLVARQQLEERSCCQHCHGNWVSDSGGVGRSLFWFFFFQIFISISFPSVYSFIYFHHFSCSTMKLLNEGPTPELNHQLRKKQVNKKKKQHSPRPCLLGLVWSS